MERFIGESHWDVAVEWLKRNPEKEWAHVNGVAFDSPRPISTTGWDYRVIRKDDDLFKTTYYNGSTFASRKV